jgi:hypothetical protein
VVVDAVVVVKTVVDDGEVVKTVIRGDMVVKTTSRRLGSSASVALMCARTGRSDNNKTMADSKKLRGLNASMVSAECFCVVFASQSE